MTAVPANQTRIVVGITDTDSCRDAVAWAAREAAARTAVVSLVLAYEPLRGVVGGSVDGVPAGTRAADLLGSSAALAREISPRVEVRTHLIEGLPIGALAELARGADLLVVGSRARNRFTADAVGTVGIELGAVGSVPIVIVRGPDPARLPEAGVLPVVAAVDGAARSAAVVEFALAEARRAQVPMTIAHVQTEPGRDRLAAAVGRAIRVSNPDVDVRYRACSGTVKDVLAGLSARARILVVGSRGRGRFAGMVLGSIAQSLTCSAQCPLVVIPPQWHRVDAQPSPAVGARDAS